MPTVTATPVQVSIDPTYCPFTTDSNPVYLHVGTSIYQVLVSVQTGANRIGIFKRDQGTVNGAWVEKDSGSSPGQGLQSGNGKATVKGTTISVAYLETGNTNMRICNFDTSTDTWGSPTATKTMLSSLATFAFVQRSDNTYVVVAGRPNAVYYLTNTAGTWSGFTVLASLASGAVVIDGVIDPSNRIHVLINTTSTTVGYYQLSAAYAFSASFTSVSLLFPGPPYPYLYYPQISLWGSTAVAITANTSLTLGSPGTVRVKVGTPLASPAFTSYDVYSTSVGEQAFKFQPVQAIDGSLHLFFVSSKSSTPRNQILHSTFDGVSAWSAPVVFYDAITDPPPNGISPPDSPSQVIHGLQALELSQGWSAAVSMETIDPVGHVTIYSTGIFLESGTTSGAVSIALSVTPSALFSVSSPIPHPSNTIICQFVITSPCRKFKLYANSVVEFIAFGDDQLNSFNLNEVNEEMMLPVAEPRVGMWNLTAAGETEE